MARRRDDGHELRTGSVTHVIERDKKTGAPSHWIEMNTDGKSYACDDSGEEPTLVSDVPEYVRTNGKPEGEAK